uniref:glucuronosyltransferase n=1 Tax=Trichuris muris TaxID=70415 RepID=A0A5S6R3D5_TRIMR
MFALRYRLLWCFFPLLANFTPTANGLEVLLYVFGISRSHAMFASRFANALTTKGHHVTTFLAPTTSQVNLPKFPTQDDLFLVTVGEAAALFKSMQQTIMRRVVNGEFLGWELVKMAQVTERMMLEVCSTVTNDTALLDRIRKHRYDVIVSNCFDICIFGLVAQVHSGKMACLSAGTYITDLAELMMAIPNYPSYTPHMLTTMTDAMTFPERAFNTLVHWGVRILIRLPGTAYYKEIQFLRRMFNWTIGSIDELSQADALFMNGEQFLDFPRPMLHEIAFMGDPESPSSEDLSDEWHRLLNESKKGIILFSFGSIVSMSWLGVNFKEQLLNAFERFPEFTVVWKLDDPSFLERHTLPSHVHAFDWVPQRQLLNSRKVKVFITHAGYNSLLEVTLAGVPVILIPLFGDQPGNAARAVRRGLGLQLQVTGITADILEEKIKQVLSNDGIATRAKAFSAMLRDKIMPTDHLIAKRFEQLVNGKGIRMFHKIKNLSSPVKLCFDIVALIGALISIMVFLAYAQCR